MFHEIALDYEQNLTDFTPYASVSDRMAWTSLSEAWKKASLQLGESYLHYTYPALTAVDFMDFSRTGNRTRYEDKFFARRQALSALVLAECIEDNGRFLDDIINGVFLICEESAWQLPAHNTYVRDMPQLPLPDAVAPVLDLFACETGAILATTCYLLKDRLDAVSPFLTKRILHELTRRIFRPYLSEHFWWMGNGKEPMNNWTIWCTQNVLLSVFLTDTNEAFRREVFLKACQSTDYFLAEYGEDGCCDEGAQYYRHAGLCLFNVMEILNGISGNRFKQLYNETKIQNIASYIWNVHISGPYYVNFADCSPIAGRAGAREFLFAQRTGNEAMMHFAAKDFQAGREESLLLPKENNLYYRLQNGFTASRLSEYLHSHPNAAAHQDIYYPSVGLFLTRDASLCLAVKAGDNGDSHNHNDTGSFTIYKNGRPLFIDIGVESYTQKTFSPRRYEIWTMQSAYHNLPTVNGYMQSDGERCQAKDVVWKMDDQLCEISMDIAATYPREADLSYYKRAASLLKGKEIVIKDSFPPDASVVLSLMTYERPVAQADGCLSIQIGTLGTLRASGLTLCQVEEIPITDTRLKTAWEHSVYRILLQAADNNVELHIS